MSGGGGFSGNRLEGRTALVTGAGADLGHAVAACFARAGARVLACGAAGGAGLHPQDLAAAAAMGGAFVFQPLDVTSDMEWRRAVDACLAMWGRLDILVNVAGGFSGGSFADTGVAAFDACYRTDVEGPWLGMKAAMPEMDRLGGGVIVNVSAPVGEGDAADSGVAAAMRGALAAMTRSVAIEGALAGRRIRANFVHPGVVCAQTVFDGAPAALAGLQGVADAILFLACDESSYMTGSGLAVDAGWVTV